MRNPANVSVYNSGHMRALRYCRTAALAAVVSAAGLSGCFHSTQLAATWRDPSAGPIHFNRPVAVFVTNDEMMRRAMEDKLVHSLPSGAAVTSYSVLGLTDASDANVAKQRLSQAGFDGAIIMRVVSVDMVPVYTPGSYWYGANSGFAGYWGNAWRYPYDPTYVDKIVTIETEIYSLASEKLSWAGRSETTNPRSVNKLGDSVSRPVTKALREEGLIK